MTATGSLPSTINIGIFHSPEPCPDNPPPPAMALERRPARSALRRVLGRGIGEEWAGTPIGKDGGTT